MNSPAMLVQCAVQWKIACSLVIFFKSNNLMCNNFRGVSLKWTLLDAIDLKMIKNKILYIFLGLRRRSLGLFKTTCSSALLNKISKECSDAAHVIRR